MTRLERLALAGTMAAMLRLAIPTAFDLCYLAEHMRPDELEQFERMTGPAATPAALVDRAARSYVDTGGPLFGLFDDNRAVMAGGFAPVRPGVAELWAIGTPAAWAAHGHQITRVCARVIRWQLTDGPLHRVQLQAIASRTAAAEWYTRGLGLTHEATLRMADTQGGDVLVFARVRP